MLTIQTLIDDLAAGCKPKDLWRIGLEHERFAYDQSTGAPLAYDGRPGIRALLETLAAKDRWNLKLEDGHPIALAKNGMTISLEPGGQVEYSGSPCVTLEQTRAEMAELYAVLDETAAALGIGLLARGFHPSWTREDINWMPKGRYKIMRAYMPKKGALGLDMMLRTCGAQINLDYATEADMVKKYRVALALQPVITALMANSPAHGYQSYRSHIWTDTDPDRSGVPAFVFDNDMGFARYVEYALDVPMYFIMRGGKFVDMTGHTFRAFLNGNTDFEPAIEDWRDHLTTLFPEVRLKHYLELRGPDSTDAPLVNAMAAFWTGLFYNETALEKSYALIKDWPAADHIRIRNDVAKNGLQTPVNNEFPDLCALAHAALPVAESGLGKNDKSCLDPFYEKITSCGKKHYATA